MWHTRSRATAPSTATMSPQLAASVLCSSPRLLPTLGDASSHWRLLLPSFLRWLSSDLCTRKHSFKFWARILGFRISSPIELGNQPLSWS